MKILFLAHYYWPHIGGVERHVSGVTNNLKLKTNNKITILTSKYDRKLKNTETKDSIKIIRFKYPHIKFIGLLYIWFWLWKNRNLLKKADIIHIHDVFIWYLPFRFIYPKKKIYLTIHGGPAEWPIPLKNKLLVKLAAKLSTGIICVGDFIPKHFGIKPDYVIYGGVDSTIKLKNQKEKLIIFLGRLEKDAGIYEFLEKIKNLKNCKIEFVGDGSLRNICEKYGVVHGFCNPTPFLEKASICFAGGYLSALEALNYQCDLWTGAKTPIKKDYWKKFPYKKGDRLPTWKSVAKIYENLYLHNG